MDIRVVDLFAGAGGFSLGFKIAGFKISAAVESFPKIAETYAKNFPDTFLIIENIKKISGKYIKNAVGEIDVVIGGPPCVPFTSRNPSRKKNPRDRIYKDSIGYLVVEFFRVVKEIKPIAYVMENVAGILDVKSEIIKIARRFCYDVYFHSWKCEEYGLPSVRKRVFISNFEIHSPAKKKMTAGNALQKFTPDLPNSEFPKIPKKYAGRISTLRYGESLIKFRGAEGYVKNWIRIDPKKPAPPITATSRFIHPYEDRGLSVREHAILMSFPNDFVFYGSEKIKYMGVGDAVPPMIAEHIAKYLLSVI